jgi:hypothetical protein
MHLGSPIVQAVLWAPQERGARIKWYFGKAFTESVENEVAMQEEIGKLQVMNAPQFCNKSIAQKFQSFLVLVLCEEVRVTPRSRVIVFLPYPLPMRSPPQP